MTIMEPPNILYIIDFQDMKDIKELCVIQLKEYERGFVTEGKYFFLEICGLGIFLFIII